MNKIREVNCETGEVVERYMTPEEVAHYQMSLKIEEDQIAARQSALSKFYAIGLTDEEINALLGNNG